MTNADFHAAFLAAQQQMRDPVKDAENPHFHNRFVSLKGICDAVRDALHGQGIYLSQPVNFEGDVTYVETTLTHTSGGSITSRCPVRSTKQSDPQAMGSAITYARRYALAAICGLAPADETDDDGEGAHRAAKTRTAKPQLQPFESVDHAVAAMQEAATVPGLHAIGKRVAASNFKGGDRDIAKNHYEARLAELQQPQEAN